MTDLVERLRAAAGYDMPLHELIARTIFMAAREYPEDFEDWETEKHMAKCEDGYRRNVETIYIQADAVLAVLLRWGTP